MITYILFYFFGNVRFWLIFLDFKIIINISKNLSIKNDTKHIKLEHNSIQPRNVCQGDSQFYIQIYRERERKIARWQYIMWKSGV